ncbi:MAG: hypothetical protein H6719_26075 [Sandaracinaceae bacterium]|nr:hypothetical protein [Sandaracinaceae bacterium]
MSGEPAFIGVLRESVEAEVTSSVASAALFAALSAWGPRVPSTFFEVVDLVRGPLRAELARRLGDARAAEIEKRIEQRLRLAEMPTGTVSAAPREPFADAPTHSMPRASGPVSVQVLAGSPVLETLVVSALGPRRVELSDAPDMLILDASDAPASWGADLELRAHAAPTICVYGSDLPEGQAAAKRLTSANVAFLGFEVEHGVAPILDLIRSRAE